MRAGEEAWVSEVMPTGRPVPVVYALGARVRWSRQLGGEMDEIPDQMWPELKVWFTRQQAAQGARARRERLWRWQQATSTSYMSDVERQLAAQRQVITLLTVDGESHSGILASVTGAWLQLNSELARPALGDRGPEPQSHPNEALAAGSRFVNRRLVVAAAVGELVDLALPDPQAANELSEAGAWPESLEELEGEVVEVHLTGQSSPIRGRLAGLGEDYLVLVPTGRAGDNWLPQSSRLVQTGRVGLKPKAALYAYRQWLSALAFGSG